MSKFIGSCMSKKPYKKLDFAIKKAKEASQRIGKKIGVYLCPYCLWWHLTSHIKPNIKYQYVTEEEL